MRIMCFFLFHVHDETNNIFFLMLCYILLPRLFLQEPQQSQGSTDSLYETIPGRYRFNYVTSEVTHSQISFILSPYYD